MEAEEDKCLGLRFGDAGIGKRRFIAYIFKIFFNYFLDNFFDFLIF